MNEKTPFFDELQNPDGTARAPYAGFDDWFQGQDTKHLLKKSQELQAILQQVDGAVIFNGNPNLTAIEAPALTAGVPAREQQR